MRADSGEPLARAGTDDGVRDRRDPSRDDTMSAVGIANVATFASAWSLEQYAGTPGFFPHEEALVRRYFPPPPARVLDLGCGAGRTSIPLRAMGYDVIAFDPSAALIGAAQRRAPELPWLRMDAAALAFGDETFDAALFSYNGLDCIFPLAARERALAEVRRVLKPGAPFVFSANSLVGRFFSGGFFYLRGHWHTLRFLMDQVGNAHLGDHYFRFRDGSGMMLLHFGSPEITRAQLTRAGFTDIEVRSPTGQTDPRQLYWHVPHAQYVARRPHVSAP